MCLLSPFLYLKVGFLCVCFLLYLCPNALSFLYCVRRECTPFRIYYELFFNAATHSYLAGRIFNQILRKFVWYSFKTVLGKKPLNMYSKFSRYHSLMFQQNSILLKLLYEFCIIILYRNLRNANEFRLCIVFLYIKPQTLQKLKITLPVPLNIFPILCFFFHFCARLNFPFAKYPFFWYVVWRTLQYAKNVARPNK